MLSLGNVAGFTEGLDRWLEAVEEEANQALRGLAAYAFHPGVVAVLDSIDEIYELLPDLVVQLGSDELVDDVQRPLLARFLYLFDAARPADCAAPLGDQQERDVRGVVDTLQNAREHLAGHAQDLVAVSS